MSIRFRSVLMVLMSTALFFGFLHLFVPDGASYGFERLHIFLFNLCSGGTIILYFSEGRQNPSKKVVFFCIMAIAYALFAFFKIYIPAIVISLILAVIVEIIRVKKFTLFPHNFFMSDAPVAEKFHQASLLCLSIGLVISGLVMLNNEYLKLVTLPKLQLNTFFLGFSFPSSLITMSVMFSLMKTSDSPLIRVLKNVGFWNVNLGVIIFFLFILFERLGLQVVITAILFLTVVMIFYLFSTLGAGLQQKNFLISGMAFLLITAVTGILYIILHISPDYYYEYKDLSQFLLKLHAIASLYGWNLSGLAVICRIKDFPILLHSRYVIVLHWITVMVLAPLGYYYQWFSAAAVAAYTTLLYVMFSAGGNHQRVLNGR